MSWEKFPHVILFIIFMNRERTKWNHANPHSINIWPLLLSLYHMKAVSHSLSWKWHRFGFSDAEIWLSPCRGNDSILGFLRMMVSCHSEKIRLSQYPDIYIYLHLFAECFYFNKMWWIETWNISKIWELVVIWLNPLLLCMLYNIEIEGTFKWKKIQ